MSWGRFQATITHRDEGEQSTSTRPRTEFWKSVQRFLDRDISYIRLEGAVRGRLGVALRDRCVRSWLDRSAAGEWQARRRSDDRILNALKASRFHVAGLRYGSLIIDLEAEPVELLSAAFEGDIGALTRLIQGALIGAFADALGVEEHGESPFDEEYVASVVAIGWERLPMQGPQEGTSKQMRRIVITAGSLLVTLGTAALVYINEEVQQRLERRQELLLHQEKNLDDDREADRAWSLKMMESSPCRPVARPRGVEDGPDEVDSERSRRAPRVQRRRMPAPYAVRAAGLTPAQQAHVERNCGPWGAPTKTGNFGRTDMVTREQYVLEHSALRKIPLWVGHYIPADQIDDEFSGSRPKWKAEPQLAVGVRAEKDDYAEEAGSDGPYSRGHMCPNADFDTKAGRASTFYLSNVVPQISENNSGLWASLEKMVRTWTEKRGKAYVITGGFLYDPDDDPETGSPGGDGVIDYKVIGDNEVVVPTHLFKIVMAPKAQGSSEWEAIAFVFDNEDYESPYDYADGLKSIDWIERRAGLNFFPALDADPAEERRIEGTVPTALWSVN